MQRSTFQAGWHEWMLKMIPAIELEIYNFLLFTEVEITYRYDNDRRYFFHHVTVKGKTFSDQCRKTAIIEAMRYATEK